MAAALRLRPVGVAVAVGWVMIGVAWAGESVKYVGPSALVVSHDAKTLYVAGADAQQVLWVDLTTGKVARRIDTPGEPSGLALDPMGRKLVVTCAAPKSTVLVLDASTGRRIAAIPAGHTAVAPVISPDGRRVYVCQRFQNEVLAVDLETARAVGRVPVVREPIAAAITPDGSTLLVANHLPYARTDPAFKGNVSPIVNAIDTHTLTATAIELAHGSNGLRGLCVAPDGRHAFVTHLLSNFESVPFRVEGGWINVNVISVIDLAQRKAAYTVGLDAYEFAAGNPWGVACTGDGHLLCVSLAGTHELCVVEQAQVVSNGARDMSPIMGVWPIYPGLGESPWQRIKLPGRGPRALAIAGAQAYVAQYFSDTVAVVDVQASESRLVRAIALGPDPLLTEQRRGEMLFHDATICYQHWQSCASCHPDGRIDGLNWDLLNDGEGNPKNTKSLLYAHRTPPAMAEGSRMSAEEAVRSGIATILYAQRPEAEAAAIDVYLRSLRPLPSPHRVDGQLSAAAQRGQRLFDGEQIACRRCHPPPLYTDQRSHNVGSRDATDLTDRFDTPTLIEVWRTAPYLHDGRYLTVRELLAEGHHGLRRGTQLSPQELDDLVEFVLSL